MSTLWQRFKVRIPEGYSPIERESIAQDIIDFVVERTHSGKDKNNRKFKPGYSEGYASSRVGHVAGKRKGGTPDLKLTGDMLESLGEYIKHSPGEIVIGYEKGSEENAKADGNVRGTYGKSKPQVHGRDFMGITQKGLKEVLSNYPLKGKKSLERRFQSTMSNAASKSEAKRIAKTFSTAHDLSFADLMRIVNEKFNS